MTTLRHVVIADPERAGREKLAALAEQAGRELDGELRVHVAKTGTEALLLIDRFKPALVLTEVVLAELNGLEFHPDALKSVTRSLALIDDRLRADEEAWQRLVEEWLSPEAEARRQEFRRDVVASIDALVERHPGERVAVVCHGGVINAYLSDVISLPGTMWFEPTYTSVSRTLAGGSHKQIVSVNETPHLPELLLPATGG